MYTGNNTLSKEFAEAIVSPRGVGKTQALVSRMSRVMAAIKTLPGMILKSKRVLTAEDMRMVIPPVEVLLYGITAFPPISIPKFVMNSAFGIGTALTEEEDYHG